MSEGDLPAPASITPDPIVAPAGITSARLGLGRAGSGLPTRAALDFASAHAMARDAVHTALDREALAARLTPLGLDRLMVDSAAPDRATYLRRPDFGRRLSRASRTVLASRPVVPTDVLVVIADGLSARAVAENAVPLVEILVPALQARGMRVGPLVLAGQGRVALGDEIASILKARLVVVLIGERPGLSAADSLGAYVTFDPRLGRTDAERNCVSNIRPGGFAAAEASHALAWLIERAFGLGLSGVRLKDESGAGLLAPITSA